MITNDKFLDLIKKPKNAKSIGFMREHEAAIGAFSTGEGFDRILKTYANRYVAGMQETVKSLFKAHTKKILAPYTGTVHSHFLKIYDSAESRNVDFNFNNNDLYADFAEFIRTAYLGDIGALRFSKEYLTTDILYNPNTRYYADFELDNEDKESIGYSSPVIKRVDVNLLHDINEENGRTDYMIFFECDKSGKPESYFLIDDERLAKASKTSSGWVVSAETLHGYKYTPVCSASSAKFFTKDKEEIKKSVISDSIDDLKAWLFIKNQDKVFFSRNQTPTEYTISSKCKGTYDNNIHYTCEDGYYFVTDKEGVYNSEGDYEAPTRERRVCHSCSAKSKESYKLGKVINVAYEDVTRDSDKIKNIKDGFGFITTDPAMLKESRERIDKDLADIETTIIGRASNSGMIKEAINEKQVKLSGESKEQTLTAFAEQVEVNEMFLFDLLGRGRYGDEYEYTQVYLGRRWFFSEQSLSSELKELREAKVSSVLIKRKEEELIQASYSYDIDFQTIVKLTNALIPFQGIELPELIVNSEVYIAQSDETSFQFRVHIDKLIAYLENEFKNNINLQLMPFEEQTKEVYTLFISYLKLNSTDNGQ